jgi:hypothetical protein
MHHHVIMQTSTVFNDTNRGNMGWTFMIRGCVNRMISANSIRDVTTADLRRNVYSFKPRGIPVPNAEVKITWISTSTPQYVFMS